MATAINDIESVRLTVGTDIYTLEKGGQISIESIGNDINFYRSGKRFLTLAYTAFTTPTFTSASDGRSQIEAFLSGGSSTATYAEDSAHTSGDTGTLILAVRNDLNAAGVPAVLAANGDYIPLTVDENGVVWVRQFPGESPLPATVNITRPANTTQYAINDVLNNGADTTPLAFTVARANDTRGWVVGGRCISSNNATTLPNIDLLLFSSTFTIAADNAAFAHTHAQNQTLLDKIRFSTWVARGSRSDSSGVVEAPFVFTPASGTQIIYGVPVLQNTYTPVSAEQFEFSIYVQRF